MSGAITVAPAEATHDVAIRALLRERPMAGAIQLSFQREPSYFASLAAEGGEHFPIVALEGPRVICVGNVAVRERFVNGAARRVGYLGQLRLAASHSGRFDILRRGYAFFRDLRATIGADLYFTSVALDNGGALRLLERGARGLPRYRPVGELVTITLPTRRTRGSRPPQAPVVAGASRPQLAPVESRFATPGIWEQRAFKQIVVAGYSPGLRLARPIHNLVSRGVKLPPAGASLHLAYATGVVRAEEATVTQLLREAADEEITMLSFTFDARDAGAAELVGRHRGWTYRTRLYLVDWPGDPQAESLDDRPLQPEAALL